MRKKTAVVNVFAIPYEFWTTRTTTIEEALDLHRNNGLSLPEALNVKDKLIEVVSTHAEAASYMLRKRADNGLEFHVDRALNVSPEYRSLRDLMPIDVPEALRSYQSEFTEDGLALADDAIRTHGVEMAEGQFLFHGGHWGSDSLTLTTSRPFSTSFCPQVALRNAEWKGKAYDAGRVDLMVVRVTRPETKAYIYSREGDHGNEKEIVFASGAYLTRVRETYIAEFPVVRVNRRLEQERKFVPAYLVEVEIS